MATLRRILVVGAGGREHALALRLLASPGVEEVLVAPGNGGTGRGVGAPPGHLRNAAGDPLEIARRQGADLVVVGPEAPLCEGLVDRLAGAGVLAYGPSRAAARLEGSKAFMKELARRAGLRTARHEVVRAPDDADRAVAGFPEPPVVKADGLCAGKGVVVAESHAEALAAARRMLSGEAFGGAGRTVVIEERVAGREASMHALCDGERVLVLPSAQDHKRIFDGDRGPNTGGMGTYAPAPLVTPAVAERVRREIFEPTVAAMAAEGTPFRGTLFAGLMIGRDGDPLLLEFNVRFGDPEAQVLLAVVEGDLAGALAAAARGRLEAGALRAGPARAVSVVLAASGYPGTPRAGDAIEGLDLAAAVPGVALHHAGTRWDGERFVTSGGRVLAVTATGETLAEARDRAYAAAARVRFEGKQLRGDVALSALEPRVA